MPVGRRQPQGGGRYPALRGALMVDTVRGQLRIRSWPKPRPGPRHPTNEFWSNWLKAATYLYRYQPASIQWELQEATRGTVYMPRDLFISCARGRAFMLQDEFGRRYYPMAFVEDVSESLDAIGQFPGMMLYRGTDLWVAIQPGSPGQSLVYVDDDNPPVWATPAAVAQQCYPLIRSSATSVVINVNNTGYITNDQQAFNVDMDAVPFTEFRIVARGQSSALGQTITCQLTPRNTPNNPISAAGDDLVIAATSARYDSGWIARSDALSGLTELNIAFKGSNSTVDVGLFYLEVYLRP